MTVRISSLQTPLLKYMPMILAPIILAFGLVTGDKVTIILFLPFFLLNIVINYFLVEAWVDKEAIYIKRLRKAERFTFDKIDKIGEFKSGFTDISIITEFRERRTFLILNPNQTFTSEGGSDIYRLLMKLKMNCKKEQVS